MVPKAPKIVTIDIETSPMDVTTYSLRTKYIPWKNVVTPTHMVSIAAKELNGPMMYSSIWDHGKDGLMKTAWEIISQADVVLSWNGNSFDIPMVNRECLMYGLTAPSPVKMVDLMRQVKSKFRFDSYALGFVSTQLGVGSKLDIGSVPDLLTPSLAGDQEARRLFKAYNTNDVLITEGVYRYLRSRGWLHTHPHMVMDGTLRCPQCSSQNLEESGTYSTRSRAYRMYQCQVCFGWVRSNESVSTAKGLGVGNTT